MKALQQVLAQQLIGDYCSQRRAGRVSHPTVPLQLQHFPVNSSDKGSGGKRGKCTVCRGGRTPNGSVRSAASGSVTLASPMTAFTCFTGTDNDFFEHSPPPPSPSGSFQSHFKPVLFRATLKFMRPGLPGRHQNKCTTLEFLACFLCTRKFIRLFSEPPHYKRFHFSYNRQSHTILSW